MRKILLTLGVLLLCQAVLLAKDPPEPAPISIAGFTLVNSVLLVDIVNLSDGAVLNLAELPTRRLNITARVQPSTLPSQIGSVVFKLNGLDQAGNINQTENVIPFALGGDNLGLYNVWTPAPGSYTLTATPYAEDDGEGKAGVGLTIHFTVIDKPLNLPRALYRINAGGGDYITREGVIFKADNYTSSSLATFTNNTVKDIAGTMDDELYRTEHISDTDLGRFFYFLPVVAGNYTVRLHFSEIYFGVPGGLPAADPVGQRVFNVNIDGVHSLTNFDIAAEVGVATALIKTFEVSSSDGNIIIDFTGRVNRAKISAIEVLASSASNVPPLVNAGPNQAIRLPQNSAILVGTWSDPDGFVTQVEWTKVSGPAATLSGVNTPVLALNDLVVGTYVFRLTATDNTGLQGSDEVVLLVLAPESLLVTAYPNPVTDVVHVVADSDHKDPADIRLYDRYGKLHYEKQGVDLSKVHLINVASFAPNMYMLEVKSAGSIETVPILKN